MTNRAPITVRFARFSDLQDVARVMGAAFFDDDRTYLPDTMRVVVNSQDTKHRAMRHHVAERQLTLYLRL
jgi:hypothetical protein